MFKELLSSIGIGSTKVNTVLFEDIIERGKEVKGEVHIIGGISEQKISEIYIHIDSEFHKYDHDMTEFPDITEPILEIKVTDPLVIRPHEEKIIPISFTIPYYTPITFGKQTVQIQTELKINLLNHPVEKHDFILIDPFINDIFIFFKKQGFRHNFESGFCRSKPPTSTNPTHCLQNFFLENKDGVKVYFTGNEKDINIHLSEKDQVRNFLITRDQDLSIQLSKLYPINK
ncbi:hypothetical protein BKP45_14295 [Anaerobacillus alkalidiazotrophicus]|uniref:Sporulation protein SpoOM n=1 Tax=Anaerobacillus alkalidiazotrophicus TaxID=472963 RepID=A0A1S2M3H2_9BACI|nr:sporulation protein [Anaerobacillus alkalidiazotrophicus]OIJ19136.1 hypothetical protein BKP45_14295 [Anaerobacillus alkalidiazotrophicus]